MRILVCVKRVPLTGGRMVLTADEQALETRHLGFTISPHEECGVEEAVRIVEQQGGEVTVLTLGPPEAEEQIRETLAIGADRGILLATGRRGVGSRGHRGGDRGARRRLRPDHLRQRVRRLGQLPGRHPRGVRARAAGRDRAQGPYGRGRASALRAGGRRWARHLRRAAARRRERARGHQPAALPVGAGEAARSPEAGRDDHTRAARAAAREGAARRAGGPGQAGRGPRRRRRMPRRRW